MTGRGRDTHGKKPIKKNHLQKAGCGIQGKPPISKKHSQVIPPGSLAIANNRMRQQKAPSAAQKAPTAIQKGPSTVQKAQPSQAATSVQAPPSQAATPVQTPPPIQTTAAEASRFIPTPGLTLPHQFEQGPLQHTTHDMETDCHHQDDEQEHEGGDQQEDEEGDIEEDGEKDKHEKDACGKFIIRPIGTGFSPADVAAAAIRQVIEQTFPDNITCYSDLKDEDKVPWFQKFGTLVSWAPHHEEEIKTYFHQRCGKRLTDMFTKARTKNKKPLWMNKDGWTYLTDRWKEEDFKKRSERNKINRASSKGGALHTTGRKAHHEIALDMSSKLGRAVYPDELFVATHKKKTGDWVDRRSEKTHAEYHENLAKVTQTDGGATRDTQEVDGSQRIKIWKDVSKGKSRGRCYGTGHLAKNLKYKNLIYEAEAPHNRAENQIIEAARAEAAAARADAEAARAEVAAARADADAARAEAAASTARTRSLEIKFEEFQSRMMALETASCSGHSRQSSHPHYDNELDDQSVDEEDDA